MDFVCTKNAPEWFSDGLPAPSSAEIGINSFIKTKKQSL